MNAVVLGLNFIFMIENHSVSLVILMIAGEASCSWLGVSSGHKGLYYCLIFVENLGPFPVLWGVRWVVRKFYV